MIVAVPKESFPGERRVALIPAALPALQKAGMKILVESGAGEGAGFADAAYLDQGAEIAESRASLFERADVIVQVRGLGANPEMGQSDLPLFREGQVLAGLLDPLGHPKAIESLAKAGTTSFSLELIPRISRAQAMDVLSSMASIAGYKAVLMASNETDKMWPLMMTAAGTIKPARVLVVGAGVAGLQAIATAHRLGAVVQAYDVRPAAREQVESLGAKFLELDLPADEAEGEGGYAQSMGEEFYRLQREMMTKVVAESDAVITTAAIPGKKSPILVTHDMVLGMRPGSVVIDLAAEGGGNCESTRLGETVDVEGVKVIGPNNLASTIPSDASQMFARNVSTFLQILVQDGELKPDRDDPILSDSIVTKGGEVVSDRVRALLGAPTDSA